MRPQDDSELKSITLELRSVQAELQTTKRELEVVKAERNVLAGNCGYRRDDERRERIEVTECAEDGGNTSTVRRYDVLLLNDPQMWRRFLLLNFFDRCFSDFLLRLKI